VAGLVWYVAYGSNLSAAGIQWYLEQGRDPSPPLADRPLTIGHGLWFGGESRRWTGGRAYVDHDVDDDPATLARAWLLTRQQWADLHGRESGRAADDTFDLADLTAGECRSVGDGRYDVLVGLGVHEEVPVVTFTGPSAFAAGSATRPAAAYLRAIAAGLQEAHGLDARGAVDYLLARPGVDQWSEDELLRVLTSRSGA
jgi:hypothetical protein